MEGKLYLDLGAALAAFGLVFAVYQLRQPRWDVVLHIRPWWQRNLFWILGIAGLLLTLTAAVIDKFHPCWLWAPLADTFPYQVLAYVAFAASPLSLLLLATTRRGLFKEGSAGQFYSVLGWHVATNDEREIDAVIGVLLANFRSICQFASKPEESEGRTYARSILDVILSDDAIVKALTTKRLDALQHILESAKEFEINRFYSPIGIPALVRNLFGDVNSFLYKQYRADGLALAMNIYETIFGSPTLLTNFRVFGDRALDYSMRQQIGTTGIDVFIEALSRATKTYLTTGKVEPESINTGLRYLSGVLGDLCQLASRNHKNGGDEAFPRSPAWKGIDSIIQFLGHDYNFIAEEGELNKGVRLRETSAAGKGFWSNISIGAAVAEAMAEAFSQLSYTEKLSNIVLSYTAVVQLLTGVMFENMLMTHGYRQRFEDEIWKRIHKNVVRRFYPATVRMYIEFFGFILISGTTQGPWVEGQADRVRRLLYIDLKPLFERGEEMIGGQKMQEALLPHVMAYRDGKFFYRARFGDAEPAEIAEPTRDASSALEGVKDEFDKA